MLKRKSRDIKHGAGPYALPARERWGSITGTQWSLLLVLEEVATLSDEYVRSLLLILVSDLWAMMGSCSERLKWV